MIEIVSVPFCGPTWVLSGRYPGMSLTLQRVCSEYYSYKLSLTAALEAVSILTLQAARQRYTSCPYGRSKQSAQRPEALA